MLYSDYQTTSKWRDTVKQKIFNTFGPLIVFEGGGESIALFSLKVIDPYSLQNYEGRGNSPIAYLLLLSFSPSHSKLSSKL